MGTSLRANISGGSLRFIYSGSHPVEVGGSKGAAAVQVGEGEATCLESPCKQSQVVI